MLVARFSALGDVAMTVPVIYSACLCYPEVEFTILTRKSMTSVFLNPPANLRVMGVNLEEYEGLGGLRRLFSELRRDIGFDGFIDLHDVLRTKILALQCRLVRIPVAVINKGRKGKRALTRANNKVLLPLISSRARYRQAFHRIGLPVDHRFEGLFAGRPLRKGDPADFACVASPKLPAEKWIGIAPFAKHEGKIYPVELMEQVVATLSRRDNTRIFLFGGGATRSARCSTHGPRDTPEWSPWPPRGLGSRWSCPSRAGLTLWSRWTPPTCTLLRWSLPPWSACGGPPILIAASRGGVRKRRTSYSCR